VRVKSQDFVFKVLLHGEIILGGGKKSSWGGKYFFDKK
jgi:hypothetical protein